MTFLYWEGDRALAGLLREAVEFSSLETLKRLHVWTWYRATGLRWPCLSRGLRQGDLQRYFPASSTVGSQGLKAQSSPDLRAQSSLSVLQAAGRL